MGPFCEIGRGLYTSPSLLQVLRARGVASGYVESLESATEGIKRAEKYMVRMAIHLPFIPPSSSWHIHHSASLLPVLHFCFL